ncbi:beta-ketoacyl-[acyl-carrier-protein] synthase family protein [Sandaracinus amylolyticus]|nr:beta-ketoacyl-[acyl-carrier-protein] synthase family protein [Sandaracinus amylolyticus]
MRDAVVITGMGAISALGTGVSAIVDAMREGRDGLSEMERFDVRALHPIRLAGWLREPWSRGERASLDAWSRIAAREAWLDARASEAGVSASRIAVVVGTTLGDDAAITGVADAVALEVGARGPRWTISTACASSANALGLARDLILAGDADLVIAGGAEILVPEIFAGFAALGVLGEGKCAPFGEDVGTTLGEGAGFVVLERAGAREVRHHGVLLGYGLSSDAWHETSPDPRGEGLARATRACLRDAGLEPDDVEYVNAHATGTAANDDAEWRGIQRALGGRAATIPVSASKGYLGHAQGAAGVLETITTLACMRAGLVPPSARVGRGRPRGPSDTVSETGAARAGAIAIALSNSAAFGGANAVVAISSEARASRPRGSRRVSVAGVGAFVVEAGAARDDDALVRACGDVDLRGADPSCRLAIAASQRALADARVRANASSRDRIGMFAGVSAPSRASVAELRRSLERGLDRASAPAFARSVCHAPIGAASRALGARGAATTVAGDGVAGMLAIAYAARWLRDRDDADRLVAGGIDERAPDGSYDAEGACLVVLAAETGGVEIAGVATAGDVDAAIASALAEAGLDRASVPELAARGVDGAPSLGTALAFVDAVSRVREGAHAVIATASGAQGAVAIVLVRGHV